MSSFQNPVLIEINVFRSCQHTYIRDLFLQAHVPHADKGEMLWSQGGPLTHQPSLLSTLFTLLPSSNPAQPPPAPESAPPLPGLLSHCDVVQMILPNLAILTKVAFLEQAGLHSAGKGGPLPLPLNADARPMDCKDVY